MNLGEFHTQVSDEINQGTRLDSFIAAYTRRAARWMERNYSFTYMDRFIEIDVDVDASDPKFISWPLEEGSSLLKSINFIRYPSLLVDETWQYLSPIEPNLLKANSSSTPNIGKPRYYWISGSPDGRGYIVLDEVGTEDFTLYMHYKSYTKWPTGSTETPWLLENAEDVMLAQTMTMLAPIAEEPEWVTRYGPMLTTGLKTLESAEYELKYSGDPDGYRTVLS